MAESDMLTLLITLILSEIYSSMIIRHLIKISSAIAVKSFNYRRNRRHYECLNNAGTIEQVFSLGD